MPKISALPAAAQAFLTDEYAVNQTGTTRKTTNTQVNVLIRAQLTPLVASTFSLNTTDTMLHINGANQSVYQLTKSEDNLLQDAKVGYGDALSIFGNVDLAKARGSEATPTAVVDNDPLGAIRFRGYNTSFWGAGYLECSVDGTPTATYVPGKMQFNLTNDSGNFIDVLGLYNNGGIAVNSTTRSFNFGNIKNIFVKEDTERLIGFAAYGTGAIPETNFMLARGTQTTPTTILANDFPGVQRYWGYDGTNWIQTGETFYKAVSVSPGLVASDYAISTRNTSGVFNQRVYVTADGDVGIGPGNTVPDDLLHVKDSVTAGGGVRCRVENTAASGNKNVGHIYKNDTNELFQGLSEATVSHWTVFSNTSGQNLITYDIVNEGIAVGPEGARTVTISVNGITQTAKVFSEFAESSASMAMGINYGNGNPVQYGGAVATGAIGAPTIVVDGQTSLQLTGFGYDGATYRPMGVMQFQVDGTPAAGDMPGKWILYTTPSGSSIPAEVMQADATQGVGIGVSSAASVESSAILELESTTRGFLPPRMTEAQRDAIVGPAQGLIVFNTDTEQWEGWDGTKWVKLG